MTRAARDRDAAGRPSNARPRDALGRPLPRGSADALDELDPSAFESDPAGLLRTAQRLLDAGRPFQAHEVLEAGWKRAASPEKGLWRALAQLAVAVTHAGRGNWTGAAALFQRAAAELRARDGDEVPYGIDARGLADAAEQSAKAQCLQPIRLLQERG